MDIVQESGGVFQAATEVPALIAADLFAACKGRSDAYTAGYIKGKLAKLLYPDVSAQDIGISGIAVGWFYEALENRYRLAFTVSQRVLDSFGNPKTLEAL